MGRRMTRSTIDLTFTQLRDVEDALARFCEALESPDPSDPQIESLAREAYLAVLALAQLLHRACADDEPTTTTLALSQIAVHELLDALSPYVTRQDREARSVLLDGEPLDAALQRMFCA